MLDLCFTSVSEMFHKCFTSDIEIEFELTPLTYKVFSCKDVRSKFLGVRLLPVQLASPILKADPETVTHPITNFKY